MPITYDSIGWQTFIRLDGDLDAVKPMLQEVSRPGVAGRAFRQVGNKSEFVQLRSIVDVASDAAAALSISTYTSMIGSIVAVVKCGVASTDWLVCNVRQLERKRVTTTSGGVLGSGGQYVVEAEWTLTKAGVS